MKIYKIILKIFFNILLPATVVNAQEDNLAKQAEEVMVKATKFMQDEVSTNGGFVWFYLPDMSRRWGEMEAYKTMLLFYP